MTLADISKILRTVFIGEEPMPEKSKTLKEALKRLDEEAKTIRKGVENSNSYVMAKMVERLK